MTPLDILLYIAVWTLCVNALSYAFTGKLPHDFIPAVKARKHRLELEAAAAEEEETWRRQALASLKKEDIAFLTAGSHWTPPSEVQYRIDIEKKNEQFAAEQKLRADRAEPVAVIPVWPTVDSITRTTTQYGHEIQITHYSDGSVTREHVKKSRSDYYLG